MTIASIQLKTTKIYKSITQNWRYHSHGTMMMVPKFHKVHSMLLHHQRRAASTEGHPREMELLQGGETE